MVGEGVGVVVTADVAAGVSVGGGGGRGGRAITVPSGTSAPIEGGVRAELPGAGDVPWGQRPHVAAQKPPGGAPLANMNVALQFMFDFCMAAYTLGRSVSFDAGGHKSMQED